MSFKVDDRVKFLDNKGILLPELANLTGVINTKVVFSNDTEPSYYVKLETGKTSILSEWFLRTFSKPIKFYRYGI